MSTSGCIKCRAEEDGIPLPSPEGPVLTYFRGPMGRWCGQCQCPLSRSSSRFAWRSLHRVRRWTARFEKPRMEYADTGNMLGANSRVSGTARADQWVNVAYEQELDRPRVYEYWSNIPTSTTPRTPPNPKCFHEPFQARRCSRRKPRLSPHAGLHETTKKWISRRSTSLSLVE